MVRRLKISNAAHVDAKTPPWFNSHQPSPAILPFPSIYGREFCQNLARTSCSVSSCTATRADCLPFSWSFAQPRSNHFRLAFGHFTPLLYPSFIRSVRPSESWLERSSLEVKLRMFLEKSLRIKIFTEWSGSCCKKVVEQNDCARMWIIVL